MKPVLATAADDRRHVSYHKNHVRKYLRLRVAFSTRPAIPYSTIEAVSGNKPSKHQARKNHCATAASG